MDHKTKEPRRWQNIDGKEKEALKSGASPLSVRAS